MMERDNFYWLPKSENWAEQFSALSQFNADDAWLQLVKLARTRLEFSQIERLAKAILRVCGSTAPAAATVASRLAVLSSCTVDHLLPSIKVGGARHDVWLDTYVPAYGQYVQELQNPESGLFRHRPDTVLFALDAMHVVGNAGTFNSAAEADAFIDAAVQRVAGYWRLAQERLGAHVIQQTLLPTAHRLVGSNEHRLVWSQTHLIAEFNYRLRAAADIAGIDLLALDDACARDGLDAWFDRVLWLKAKQEVSPSAAPMYGELLARVLAARKGRASKCLVLDLDNTLWGGVIGDDGLSGIVLGEGNAVGEAFASFQRYARRLSQRGIILAVCSKNDESNAKLPFTSHPEMVLKENDIACFVANWTDKATNIKEIAKRLNIGLDSLVFADDNPFERSIVRRELPMVMVPEMPEDPAWYADCIADAGYFDINSLTAEDFERSNQYQANTLREALMSSATDLEGYLASLNMELVFGHFDVLNQVRITQLINKTNQFNLTTKRYSEEDVKRVTADPAAVALHFRLLDQFGDNGIICIVIAMPTVDPTCYEIDTWLMSCRVLGRQVERATLNILVDEVRKKGAKSLLGRYLPTAKNGMVEAHYETLGFTLVEGDAKAGKLLCLDVDAYVPAETAIKSIKEVL